jgi:glycine/D-amino acid oxidase-like deaminating enzyme
MLGDGWLWVAKKGSGLSPMHEADTLNAHGATVEHWSADWVTAHLRSPLYADAVYFPTAFHIHPLNYIGALATAAQDAGVRIFENTPAVSIDPAGVRKRIDTPAGRVRARQVVIAGNTRIGGPMPRLSATLLPVTTYVVTTAPLGPALSEAIAFRGAVSDTDWADNHFRIVDGDRLMWSGGCTAWQRDPNGFRKRLAKDIRRTFPQLDSITIDYAWSGTLGVPVHRMPQIGELTSGLWVASGFSGHGINTTAMAGRLIAAAITDGDDRWRLFSPYHLAWAGGAAGRVAMQASYRLSRFRDLLQARLRATSQRGEQRT